MAEYSDFDSEHHTPVGVKVNLASFRADDDLYSFDMKNKMIILKECFKNNRNRINPHYRNCFANVHDSEVYYNDIVIYQAKEYRVVAIFGEFLIIKNTKRILKVEKKDVSLKIKDPDEAMLLYIYKMLYSVVDGRMFDETSFFITFVTIFDVDGHLIYKNLDGETQVLIKKFLDVMMS